MKIGFFDKHSKERHVSKAFLITGGNEKTRQQKYKELCEYSEHYEYLMYSHHKGDNELAVIFSVRLDDFESMTFQEAKALAGSSQLGLYPVELKNKPRFGVINVTPVVINDSHLQKPG